MSLGQAFINSVILLQRFFKHPFYYDIKTDRLTSHPDIKSPIKMFIWRTLTILGTLVAGVFPAVHMVQLFRTYNNHEKINMEEAIIYAFIMSIHLQYFVSWYTPDAGPQYYADLTTEMLQFDGVAYKGWPWPLSDRIPEFPELFGYGMTAGFLLAPISGCALPLLREYDPASLVLVACFPLIPPPLRMIIASVFIMGLMLHGCIVCLIMLLLMMSCVSAMEVQTKRNRELSEGIIPNEEKDFVYKIILFVRNIVQGASLLQELKQWRQRKKSNGVHDKTQSAPMHPLRNFKKRHAYNQQLYISIYSANANSHLYTAGMALAGMSIVVTTSVALIRLSGTFEVILVFKIATYVSCFGVTALIFFFCFHGTRPIVESTEMIDLWKRKKEIMLNKECRRIVKSTRPVGFTIGSFFIAKKSTALDMMQTIVDYSITFVMV